MWRRLLLLRPRSADRWPSYVYSLYCHSASIGSPCVLLEVLSVESAKDPFPCLPRAWSAAANATTKEQKSQSFTNSVMSAPAWKAFHGASWKGVPAMVESRSRGFGSEENAYRHSMQIFKDIMRRSLGGGLDALYLSWHKIRREDKRLLR